MLAEDLLLLALHDKKGGEETGIRSLAYRLSGALILELSLRSNIRLEDENIVVINPQSTGDELLDETLQLIIKSEKNETVKHWIREINNKIKNLQTRLSDRLVERGVLILEKKKFLGIFTRHRYPSINPHQEIEVREESELPRPKGRGFLRVLRTLSNSWIRRFSFYLRLFVAENLSIE